MTRLALGVLSYGLRLNPLPRTLLLGLVFLALHLGVTVFVHDGIGLGSPGPWVSAGLGLGFLLLGGGWLLPFVLLGNLLSAYVLLPAASGPVRLVWPLLASACWMIVAAELRRVNGVFRAWSPRGVGYFSLCVFIGTVVSSCIGAALLKSGANGSVLPLHALALGIFEPQFLGALLAAPLLLHLSGGFRGKEEPRQLLRPVGIVELVVQLAALLVGTWLLAFTDATAWFPVLGLLVWVSLRQGLAGGCLVALALCVAASQHRELTLPDIDGIRSIMLFEITVAFIGLGLGAWSDEQYRKRQILQESCDRMDVLMEHGGAGVWDWQTGQPIHFEGAWHNLCSLPPGTRQVGEESWYALVHPDDLARVRSARDMHIRGELPRYEIEYRVRSSSGFYRWVLDRGIVMRRDATGRGVRMVGLCMDLSTRKHVESTQLRFLEILDSVADPVAATDLHGNVFYANRNLLALHGDRSLGGVQSRHISDYFSESSAKLLLRDILPQVSQSGAWWGASELIDSSGQHVPVSLGIFLQKDTAGQPRAYGYLMRRLEHVRADRPKSSAPPAGDQLQVERQESLRLLAGGAVHTFNNVLMAIMGNAFLARKDLPSDAPSRHFFQQIDQATQRGSQFCQSLQMIAGKVPPGVAKLDFHAHAKGLLPVLLRDQKGAELVELHCARELPLAVADAAQVERVLRHLLHNAFEAYGDTPGPVQVRLDLVALDPAGFRSPAPMGVLQKGDYIALEVSDNGPGVDVSLHSRIFDPFFSTKAGHKGIGLAEVAGILRGHNGALRVDSAPRAGFTIQLFFPVVQVRGGGGTRPPLPAGGEKWRGSGQILVIDDEETVREVTASMLESLGFSPLVAKDGMEGLRILRQHASTVRLVLLDFSMPIMDGETTLAEVSKLRPELPVLFMSGHESRELKSRVSGDQVVGVLGKPFSHDVLQAALRRALEAS